MSRYDSNEKVRIQVCFPNKRVYFKDITFDKLEDYNFPTEYSRQQLRLAPKTIRRVESSNDPRSIHNYGIGFTEVLFRDGMPSAVSGWIPLHDSTVSDQPVYEPVHGRPAKNYVAISVNLVDQKDKSEGAIKYWFTLPKSIPDDKFTSWFNPASMEDTGKHQNQSVWWQVINGKDMPIYQAPADSPKMRFSFKKNLQDFTGKRDNPAVDILPALTAARMKYRTPTSGKDFVYEFVEKTNDIIPACD